MYEDQQSEPMMGTVAKEEPRMNRSMDRQTMVADELLSVIDTLEKRLSVVSIPAPVSSGKGEEANKRITSPLVEAIDRNSDKMDVAVSRIRMILSGLEI